jgi:hypothetical protein
MGILCLESYDLARRLSFHTDMTASGLEKSCRAQRQTLLKSKWAHLPFPSLSFPFSSRPSFLWYLLKN